MKRSPIKSRPKRRTAAEKFVRLWVFERDEGCVMRPHSPCFGDLTPHHLRKEGRGGAYSSTNLVTLCAHHNSWVEDHPPEAHELGLVVRNGETHEQAWERMRAHGLVDYGPGGAT